MRAGWREAARGGVVKMYGRLEDVAVLQPS